MVCEFGMSDLLGPLRYTSREQHVFLSGEVVQPREHSEATAELIDKEIKNLVDTAYQDADRLIRENLDDTRKIAEALLKYESLTAAEVERILAGESLPRLQVVPPNSQPVAALS